MMRLPSVLFATCLALPAVADPVSAVTAAAQGGFDEMPRVEMVERIAGNCGATAAVHDVVAYCTSENVIFVAAARQEPRQTAYLVAHAFGHAVQVRHGVADVALREIRNRPADELALRGMVERQVDCIAGFLWQRSGLAPADLRQWYTDDPLDVPHWGRNPLRIGPHLEVPVPERQEWFAVGQEGDLSACTPGEFGSALLVNALRE